MANSMKRKVIIDCDPGTDDAQAIMMLLSDPTIDLLAITTLMGNNSAENCARNALRILNVCQRLDIPVFAGAEFSLRGEETLGDQYHGKDGLGGIEEDFTISETNQQNEKGCEALVRLINENPSEVILLCCGPLTNLAISIHIDPMIGSKLQQLVIMGGNIRGRGNMTTSAEFNFAVDPEAAYLVLKKIGIMPTIITFDVCKDFSISWEKYDELTTMPHTKAKYFREIDAHTVRLTKSRGATEYAAYDQLAAAIVMDESVVTETTVCFATVELQGNETRGQFVCDWNNRHQMSPNVRIVQKIDFEKYIMHIKKAFTD